MLVLAVIYWLAHGSFWLVRVNLVAIYGIVIVGWNLLFGLSGQFSLGHAAFFGLSGYVSALLAADQGVPVLLAIGVGTCAAVGVGAVLAIPLLRVRGMYLAFVTLAFAVIVANVAEGWSAVTGGGSGLIGIPGWELGPITSSSPSAAFAFLWTLALLSWLTARAIWRSPFGKGVIAQREDEVLAGSLGLPVPRLRVKIFLASIAYAGAGGGLLAHYQGFIDPSQVGMLASFDIVVAGVVGGALTPIGGVIGGFVHVVLPAMLGQYAEWSTLIFGLLLVGVMMLFQSGLAGAAEQAWQLVRRKTAARAVMSVHSAAGTEPSRSVHAWQGLGPHQAARADEREPQIVLQATQVSRHFGGVKAVDSVSVTVVRDEVLAIIGPNGAGKTTLFNMLSGLIAPDTGRIEIGGVATVGMRPWEISRLGVARTFQTPHLVPGLSVLDNIALGAYGQDTLRLGDALLPRRRRPREAIEVADHWGQVVGLGHVLSAHAADLPLAQQRFVEIARALAASPAIILFDELGAGLTRAELHELGTLLRMIHAGGQVAVVVIDHRMSLVLDIADRVMVLDRGRELASGTGEEIASNDQVRNVYLGADFVPER